MIINDNENPFFGALRNLPVPFSAFDPNYRVVFWNRGCERITGYSAQDIVENPKAWEILFPDRDHRRRMFMEWIDRKNDYQDWEWDVTCKDGSVKTIAWSTVSGIQSIPGWICGCVGVDTTKKKAADAAMESYRRRIHRLENQHTEQLKAIQNQLISINDLKISSLLTQSLISEFQNFIQNRENLVDLLEQRTHEFVQIKASLEEENRKRQEVEQRIQDYWKDKDSLVRKFHRWSQSNLEIVWGLLELQKTLGLPPVCLEHSEEVRARIRALLNVHERMFHSANGTGIDADSFFRFLLNTLSERGIWDPRRIRIDVDTQGILLNIDNSIPCGLILNELVSNALLHAFPGDRKGSLRIAFHFLNKHTVELSVRDDGQGLPEDSSIWSIPTLGLKLVKLLAEEHLGGQMEWSRQNGTEFKVRFDHRTGGEDLGNESIA